MVAGCGSSPVATPEQWELRSDKGSLVVMNPATSPRFHMGSRFDASSVITDWTAQGVRIFAPWREPHEPTHAESVSGPAEEFGFPEPQEFSETEPGKDFMKIGVGLLRRPDDQPYDRNRPYEIIDPGQWHTEAHADRILLRHDLLNPETGRAYRYEKMIRLEDDGITLHIERTLTNTGTVPITTNHYAHNFISFDGRAAHTGYELEFPVDVVAQNPTRENFAAIAGPRITFGPEPFERRSYFARLTTADPAQPLPHRVALRHPEVPVVLHIETISDSIERLVVFALDRVICPEFFVPIHLQPNETYRWQTRYRLAP